MTDFHVEVVRIGAVEKHPNADTLSTTKVHDYPVIMRTGEFEPGDLAVYVPVDAVVPEGDPRWAFLGGHRRIKAKRLRGTFSMGLLTSIPAGLCSRVTVGDDLAGEMGITKYEPPVDLSTAGECEKDPGFMPCYTDIEGLRRWPDALVPGEEVTLTEKLHGANARYAYHAGRLWCGSRTQIKADTPKSIWWQAARKYNLSDVLAQAPGHVFYGEVYGQVQDLKYDVPASEGARIAFFDVLDINTRRYLDHDAAFVMIRSLGLPTVPVLARGTWPLDDHRALAEGSSTIAKNVREGFVVKPTKERFDAGFGRVILKFVGEGYLTRKGG